MTNALEGRNDDRIAGVLSCYDRVVTTGTIPTVRSMVQTSSDQF